jgi:parallel beta-helix repeat protein
MTHNHLCRVLVAVASIICADAAWAVTIFVNCPGGPSTLLQSAIDAATAGDVIQITGQCEENVLVRNEKQRITIQASGPGPHILPPSQLTPAINVRGKGILIQNLTITGGRDGIHVNRGSNAVLNNLIISGSQAKVRVDQQSFAAITNSTISGGSYGIFVDGSSDVRVGFNLDTDASVSPNTIQSAQIAGIWVQGASRARVAGNLIKTNLNGIMVRQNSHAEVGGNDISSSGDHGVYVVYGGSVDFSPNEGGAPSFLQAPNNSNTGLNGVTGVLCEASGGYVHGNLGTMAGFVAAKSITAPCYDQAS